MPSSGRRRGSSGVPVSGGISGAALGTGLERDVSCTFDAGRALRCGVGAAPFAPGTPGRISRPRLRPSDASFGTFLVTRKDRKSDFSSCSSRSCDAAVSINPNSRLRCVLSAPRMARRRSGARRETPVFRFPSPEGAPGGAVAAHLCRRQDRRLLALEVEIVVALGSGCHEHEREVAILWLGRGPSLCSAGRRRGYLPPWRERGTSGTGSPTVWREAYRRAVQTAGNRRGPPGDTSPARSTMGAGSPSAEIS